ncbi:flagellar hook-associated protein FlgK [Schinkia azotoformans]|uniref:flagellar hook-associated protein FlgK n=1 Tax=Schinkia azotoformans TaxID=1454 RepID=UPI002DB8A355|nr:flagellar hook-associated protein FlgK [Schinkia azotoformans]MEC1770239.1 flagellar hook-associated protein FlgK [Schinkia azotoformans]MED4365669.1 flagellar hook-associated protein FlgK [Schinkia azotoformans]
MSISTFYGLEVARRGIMTQQAALYVTGHNISNANTPGYTRQRVNFEATQAYPPVGRDNAKIPGQMGTGVQAGDIQRIRDSFVDTQFRGETSKLGYWDAKSAMLSQMEDIMNEPSDTGLTKSLDGFWNSLQDLASQPQNSGARRVVRQRGIALANTFNYLNSSLKAVQKDYRNELGITESRVNSLLRQINQVNKQIGAIEPNGYLPNDLYDKRDSLVDELSSYVNIKVEAKASGGLSSVKAEGLYNIYLTTPQGDILKDSNGKEIKLIDAIDDSSGTSVFNNTAYGIHINYENRSEDDSPVQSITFLQLNEQKAGFVIRDGEGNLKTIEENSVDADNTTSLKYQLDSFSALNTNGKLKGFIEGYGYTEGSEKKGLFNEMLADLDTMVYTFATEFNRVHKAGWSLNEISNNANDDDFDFFDLGGLTDATGAASKIKVAKAIIDSVDNIAAAEEASIGNGSNALKLANVKDTILTYGDSDTSAATFFQGMIGSLGDQASEANRMTEIAATLQSSVDQRRMSISNVSLDEEMTNMIKFQHAYNAAARQITLVDEILDKIINGMGLAGR